MVRQKTQHLTSCTSKPRNNQIIFLSMMQHYQLTRMETIIRYGKYVIRINVTVFLMNGQLLRMRCDVIKNDREMIKLNTKLKLKYRTANSY